MLTSSTRQLSRVLALAAALVWPSAAVATAPSPTTAQESAAPDTLVVDEGGLPLYPRWNKLFPPITTLDPGTTLDVVQDRGNWKHVHVVGSGLQGWVFCQAVPARGEGSSLSLPMAASPTTSGLVTKGWSPRQHAASHGGADPVLVQELLDRRLDHGAYLAFLAADPPPDGLDGTLDLPDSALPTDPDARPWNAGARDAMEALDRELGTAPDDTERQLRKKGAALSVERFDLPLADVLGEADELALGTAVAARVLGDTPALPDGPLTSYVSFVGLRLVETLPGGRAAWRFAILDTDEINAFSLPGGFVFVTRGALEGCGNEAQLAALLAHEVAHVTLRHAVVSLDQDLIEVLRNASRAEMDELLGNDEATQQLIDELDQVGDELYAMSQAPFRQELEIEADKMALQLMVRAGYDPREGLALLQQLSARVRVEDLLGSHPPVGLRLEVAEQELLQLPAEGSVGSERLDAALRALGQEQEPGQDD